MQAFFIPMRINRKEQSKQISATTPVAEKKQTVTVRLWVHGQNQKKPWAEFEIPESFHRGLVAYAKKNGITLDRAFDIAIGEFLMEHETKNAIARLQLAIITAMGDRVKTETGASTLTIAHDEISLTDAGNNLVAFGIGDVSRELATPERRKLNGTHLKAA